MKTQWLSVATPKKTYVTWMDAKTVWKTPDGESGTGDLHTCTCRQRINTGTRFDETVLHCRSGRVSWHFRVKWLPWTIILYLCLIIIEYHHWQNTLWDSVIYFSQNILFSEFYLLLSDRVLDFLLIVSPILLFGRYSVTLNISQEFHFSCFQFCFFVFFVAS